MVFERWSVKGLGGWINLFVKWIKWFWHKVLNFKNVWTFIQIVSKLKKNYWPNPYWTSSFRSNKDSYINTFNEAEIIDHSKGWRKRQCWIDGRSGIVIPTSWSMSWKEKDESYETKVFVAWWQLWKQNFKD